MDEEPYERLARKVAEARKQKFRFVEDARQAAGISRGAWDNVEKGRPAKDFTYSAIEKALGWPLGESRRILAGEDAEPADEDSIARLRAELARISRELDRLQGGESLDKSTEAG